MKHLGLITAAVLALSAGAWAQSAKLQANLDKQVELSAKEMLIQEVFDNFTKQTGVKFEIEQDVLDLLPYDKETRLSVTVKNVTLRDALTPILGKQGLDWVIDKDKVRIVPSEPLFRTGRRASYEELTLLGRLLREDLKPTGRKTAGEQESAILAQLQKLSGNDQLTFNFDVSADDKAAAFARAEKALPTKAATWLDTLCSKNKWTWYVSYDEIIILDRKKQYERQLEKLVPLKYDKVPLSTVLMELAHQARVDLSMEPGVLNYLPAEQRNNFSLQARSAATVAEAFRSISGLTGLTFTVTSDGVEVTASKSLTSTSRPAQQRRRLFVRMTIPTSDGGAIEVMIPSEELPEDVQRALENEKSKLIEKIRRELKLPTPASKPAPTTEKTATEPDDETKVE